MQKRGPTVEVHPGSSLNWVTQVMDACWASEDVGGQLNRGRYCNQVADCFFDSIGENSKANLAARQTIVALWPAMVGFICAMYPDAAEVAYDHMGWAILFALTSGGIGGERPIKRLSAPDLGTAKAWCNESESPPLVEPKPHRQSERTLKLLRTTGYVLLLLSLALYAVFFGIFLWTLKKAILTWRCSPWWFGALWYWISCVPALVQAVHRSFDKDNIILFQQTRASPNTFVEMEAATYLEKWKCILVWQFTNRPYRLIVLTTPESVATGLLELTVVGLRLGIFIFGSVTQSSLIVMPTPRDSILFGLIVGAAFFPRVFWAKICSKGVHPDSKVIFAPE